MSADRILLGLALLSLAAHGVAFGLAWRGWWRAVPLLNAAVAVPILAYQALRLRRFWAVYLDPQLLALLGFEVAILILAVLALCGLTWARRLTSAGFALHVLANLAVLVFALTFRLDRMF